ncbi:SANT/Myb-like DNA-binding domain-containing protein [Aspergillus melleus]|uniref:SANT/Myb-like DNA-binding domain-containing protein n=1 Tax=Aspergillus melleus TaxID=138277 RepID=UPI001E8DA70E|nr:uncharacterized protein LDX57_005126 [Aspergillus melleus]KAH8427411.1 hypothetical protein LDX57_005126 [Aspergillus melleus]
MSGPESTKQRRQSASIQQKIIKRGTWLPAEDTRLREAVAKYGPRWVLVANEVGSRNGDQCAKRWNENLNPELDHSPWTPEEVSSSCGIVQRLHFVTIMHAREADKEVVLNYSHRGPLDYVYLVYWHGMLIASAYQEEQLMSLVTTYGNNWKFLANSFFEPRAPLALKNRYSLLMRRLKRQGMRDQMPITNTETVQMPLDSISSSETSRSVSMIPTTPVNLESLFSCLGEPNAAMDVTDGEFPTLLETPSDTSVPTVITTTTSHRLQGTAESPLAGTTTESDPSGFTWRPDAILGMSPRESTGILDPHWKGSEIDIMHTTPENRPSDRESRRKSSHEAGVIEYSVSCQRGKLKSLVGYLVEAAMSESADGAMEEDQITLTLNVKS